MHSTVHRPKACYFPIEIVPEKRTSKIGQMKFSSAAAFAETVAVGKTLYGGCLVERPGVERRDRAAAAAGEGAGVEFCAVPRSLIRSRRVRKVPVFDLSAAGKGKPTWLPGAGRQQGEAPGRREKCSSSSQ